MYFLQVPHVTYSVSQLSIANFSTSITNFSTHLLQICSVVLPLTEYVQQVLGTIILGIVMVPSWLLTQLARSATKA
jgi:hypothetical protein